MSPISTARSTITETILAQHAREATLATYEIDEPIAEALQALVQVTSLLTGAEMTLVNLAGMGDEVYQAGCGVDPAQAPCDIDLCRHPLETGEVFEVIDASQDPRFRQADSVVGEPGIRYYLGIPIKGYNGVPVGTVCALDPRPRLPLRETERGVLIQLVQGIELTLERGREARIREAQLADVEADLEALAEAIDSEANQVAATITRVQATFDLVDDALHEDDIDTVRENVRSALDSGKSAMAAFLDDPEPIAEGWQGVVLNAIEATRPRSEDLDVSMTFEDRLERSHIDSLPANAARTVEQLVGISVETSPREGTVGVRLQADRYFVSVSVYREHPGIESGRPADDALDYDSAFEQATRALVAAGGYLEQKPWDGGVVLRAWYPLDRAGR